LKLRKVVIDQRTDNTITKKKKKMDEKTNNDPENTALITKD
jgi:hypothetical protein